MADGERLLLRRGRGLLLAEMALSKELIGTQVHPLGNLHCDCFSPTAVRQCGDLC